MQTGLQSGFWTSFSPWDLSTWNLSTKLLDRGKNVGGASGPHPGAVFQVSGWWESPLPRLASRGPPPYLQFICIFGYLGLNSLRAGEGGPHSYSNRARAHVRNVKRQGFSSNTRKFSSCKQQNPVLFWEQGWWVGGGWAWWGEQKASLLPNDLHLKTQHPLDFRGPHCGSSSWTPGAFSRQGLMLS